MMANINRVVDEVDINDLDDDDESEDGFFLRPSDEEMRLLLLLLLLLAVMIFRALAELLLVSMSSPLPVVLKTTSCDR